YYKPPTENDPLMPVFSSIKEHRGEILFQSFQQIFFFDPKTEELVDRIATKEFNRLVSSDQRAFVQDTGRGLFEIVDKEFHLIRGTDTPNLQVVGLMAQEDKSLLIVSKHRGVWTAHNGQFIQTNWESNALFEKHLVNDVKNTKDGQLIFATQRNGIYLVSPEGKVLSHFNKSKGLHNNTVLLSFPDRHNNIWLGFDNAINHVQTSNSTRYLTDEKGLLGTVYTSLLKDSLLYLGTNQGVFVKNLITENSLPRLISGSQEQVWSIQEVDGAVLVAHQNGVSQIIGDRLRTLNTENGAWLFKKHPRIADLLYVGYYSGICLFKKVKGRWVFQYKLADFGESSRFMEFDKYGQLWVAHPQKGYYRIVLSSDGEQIRETEFYGTQNSHIDPYAYFTRIDGNLIFYNAAGFFEYDPLDNDFIKAKYPSEIFKTLENINSLQQYGDIFWYSTRESLGYLLRKGNRFQRVEEPFQPIRKSHVLNDFNKFIRIHDSLFAVGMDEGLLFHSISPDIISQAIDPPLIQSIKMVSPKDTLLASPALEKELRVPYSHRFLQFTLATPSAPVGSLWKMQYKLEGLNDQWSNWQQLRALRFPGLSPGTYTLSLRVKDGNQNVSKIVQRGFYVQPPWYFHKIAIALYVLIFVVVIAFLIAYFKRKNQQNMVIIKRKEIEKRLRQQEKFDLEKLSLEIKKKNFELASSTLNNIKKNELILELKKNVEVLKQSTEDRSLHSQVNLLLGKIDKALMSQEDWLTFELHFRNAHEHFFGNIRAKHQDLSPNDFKLCAYLKLNLSSKEIASLMNISPRSVEQNRYRLRQKLGLAKEEKLGKYIQSF
ncbi:MAG: triple tyrosine motif-containing protein, partial [Lutibacter sp.]|nr:triple tyrosine motif-containing protein [Lutibacter sp.]